MPRGFHPATPNNSCVLDSSASSRPCRKNNTPLAPSMTSVQDGRAYMYRRHQCVCHGWRARAFKYATAGRPFSPFPISAWEPQSRILDSFFRYGTGVGGVSQCVLVWRRTMQPTAIKVITPAPAAPAPAPRRNHSSSDQWTHQEERAKKEPRYPLESARTHARCKHSCATLDLATNW